MPDPGNPQDWDRYAYVRNNPVNNTDPTGNTTECGLADGDYCNLINIEYSQASDWQESGLNHDEFVLAYEAYEYYSENPQTALQDAMNDSASYFLADTYSEYVLHQFYQPFSELDVYEELDKAIAAKNVTNYWGLLSWLFAGLVFQSDKGYGGGGSIQSLKGQLAIDAAKELGYTRRISPNKAPFNSHGQQVFFNPKTKTYISPDIDAHHGGVWKMFDRKGTRLGTYDAQLKWIGE